MNFNFNFSFNLSLKTTLQTLLAAGCVLTSLMGQSFAAEMSPADILRQIDSVRLPQGGFEAEITITPSQDGVAQEPGKYTIRSNGGDQVLVEAKNPDQRGQKFLTTESGIFFFAPRTKRAIRMTPLQTLRGQASIGDISRLHFSSDYTVEKSATAQAGCAEPNCLVLELKVKNEAATYSRILLNVKRSNNTWQPVKASLFLASGKLTKTVEFGNSENALPPPASYIDAINTRLESKVVYQSLKPAKFPASMFNPRSLEQ